MSTKGECPEDDIIVRNRIQWFIVKIVKRDSKRFIVMLFKYIILLIDR